MSPEREAEQRAALDDPASIRFEVTGRNGAVYSVGYAVHPGQRARILATTIGREPTTTIEQFAMNEPVRVDVAIPRYLLMGYGIECVPFGVTFPDEPGAPDD